MLARARFGDDSRLAHAPRQQYLADAIVNLVGARMEQIFALKINASAAAVLSQTFREEQRSRTASVIAKQVVEFVLKSVIRARGLIRHRQLFQRGHQSLGHEAPAVTAPVAKRIRLSDC